jgi:hypothetical protein
MRGVESTIIGAPDERGRHDRWSETPADFIEADVRLLVMRAKAPRCDAAHLMYVIASRIDRRSWPCSASRS